GSALILVLLAVASWSSYNGYAVHQSAQRADQHVLVAAIDRLRAFGVPTSCVIVDNQRSVSGWHVANYQFFVPTSSFALGDTPKAACGPLIVSASPDVTDRFPAARPVSYENHVPIALWVDMTRVPVSRRGVLNTSGLLGPVPLNAPLPDSAYRS